MEKLTQNAISRLLNGENVSKPCLQVLAYKRVVSEGQPRYRLMLSDGTHSFQTCIMMGPLIPRLEKGEFERFTIIQLNQYVVNTVQDNKKVIVILDPEVKWKGTEINGKIGSPEMFNFGAPSNSNTNTCGGRILAPSNPSPLRNPAFSARSSTTNGSGLFHSRNTSGEPFNEQRGISSSPNLDMNLNICRIQDINPYLNRWAFKGRATAKTPIRTWSNAKGEGKVFSFDMQDDSGEIRITAFKNECDRYYDLIEVGKVYTVTKGTIKTANRKFSQVNHDYEITLNSDSIVLPSDDNDRHCPKITFKFVKIKDIANYNVDSIIDVLGICRDVSELVTLTQKNTGRELKKREISLIDDTETEIRLAFWGNEAENFSASEGSVVMVKKARVSDFNGKSLTSVSSSFVQIDPQLTEAYGLKGWYERMRDNMQITKLSVNSATSDSGTWRTLNEVSVESISSNGGSLVFSAKATIVQVGRTQIYMSCPTTGCKKKLVDMNNGFYKCDKCQRDFDNYSPRIILSLAISDSLNEVWISMFHDEAEKILGVNGGELMAMKDNDETQFDELMTSLNFKSFIFRLRSSIDHYKEETRVRTTVLSVSPLNLVEYGKKLLSKLREMDI
ncbi:Replication protein A DNA-binding subunit-like protein [Dinothrombium tinctorium]|uniref:Replication protein A subunit n=1 Tax=Dinothrombium tinctorium TaxID=1965070 RepID=A0A3S3PQ37_9ACAR|nr:Replication protein A DNA-binding subunit-like protein [Dinothrombium tinctorium]